MRISNNRQVIPLITMYQHFSVENATYYELSVWRMSPSNSSLYLDRRNSMGFGARQAQAHGGGAWLVRGSLGVLRQADEAGAAACNRYGCSEPLLLRPTDGLLQAASPPWWHCKYQNEAIFYSKDSYTIQIF